MLRQLVRNASLIAAGTALGQGFVVIATPWLARSYAPSDFGSLALMTSVSNIALATACLRYDLALPSAPPSQAHPLLIVAANSSFISSMLVFCVLYVLVASTGTGMTYPFDSPLIVAICVFLAGIHQAMLGWATRLQDFGRIAVVRIFQGLGFCLLAAIPVIGLVGAHVLSFLAALVAFRRDPHPTQTQGISPLRAALQNRQFPMAGLPGAVLDVVGYSVCIWIITGNYGPSEAGQYAQVQRLLGAPLMLVGMSLGQALLRHSADVVQDPVLMEQLFLRLFKILATLGAAVVMTTAVIGAPMLHWFLGPQWRVDVAFIVPITIAVAARACTSPLSSILITLRRFDLALRWQALYFVSVLTVLGVASQYMDFTTFVMVYAAHECVLYSIYLLLIKSSIQTSPCAESSD